MKVEVAVLGSPSLTVQSSGAVCESRGGRPGLPVPNSSELRSCVKVEVAVQGSLFVPNSPYGLCGRKATTTERR